MKNLTLGELADSIAALGPDARDAQVVIVLFTGDNKAVFDAAVLRVEYESVSKQFRVVA
jgi:hypothetical protein